MRDRYVHPCKSGIRGRTISSMGATWADVRRLRSTLSLDGLKARGYVLLALQAVVRCELGLKDAKARMPPPVR